MQRRGLRTNGARLKFHYTRLEVRLKRHRGYRTSTLTRQCHFGGGVPWVCFLLLGLRHKRGGVYIGGVQIDPIVLVREEGIWRCGVVDADAIAHDDRATKQDVGGTEGLDGAAIAAQLVIIDRKLKCS